MSIAVSPDPKEVAEIQFSSIGNFQIGSNVDEIKCKEPGNCLAVSNQFSRVYVGCKNELVVLESLSVESSASPEPLGRIPLPERAQFVSLNADQTTLVVVLQVEEKPIIYLFDTRALEAKDFKPFLEIPSWTPPGCSIVDLSWNPVIPSTFCVVYSNGSLALYLISDGKADLCTLPPAAGITCVSWSPKGKQLVTGKKNGVLTQYKPDLKEAKNIPCPPTGATTLSVVSILWISTYQFAVGYQDSPGNSPACYIVQSSKAGTTTYTNYDDITYASGESPHQKFSFLMVNEWNIILCISTCSMELAILGGSQENTVWEQMLLVNDRAEMPMKDHKDERYPVGMGLSLNSSKVLTLNESASLPHPMPILYLLSADGLLSCFYFKNLFNGSPNITFGPSSFSTEGMRAGLVTIKAAKPAGKAESTLDVPTQVAPVLSSSSPDIGGAGLISVTAGTSSLFPAASSSPGGVSSPFGTSTKSSFGGVSSPFGASKTGVTSAPFGTAISTGGSTSIFGSSTTAVVTSGTSSIFGSSIALGTSSSSVSTPFATSTKAVPASDFSTLASTKSIVSGVLSTPASTLATPLSTSSSFAFSTPKGTQSKDATQPTSTLQTSLAGTKYPPPPSLTPSIQTKNTPQLEAKPKQEVPVKIFQKAIHDEIAFFQKEIDDFQSFKINVDIGSEDEKHDLKKLTEEINKFCDNVCEITNAQTKEISSLQNLSIEGFEWIEEARSREIRNNDPKYLKALRGRALDPLSQKMLDNVLSKYMYLDQQLREVNNVLDIEWEDYQDKSRKKKYSSSVQSKETVYKALLNNHKVLEAQKLEVEALVDKVNEFVLKESNMNAYNAESSMMNKSISEVSDALEKSVISLCNNSYQKKKKKEEMSSPIKTFSPKKEAALRQFLAHKGSVKVRSTRPTNLSESRFLKFDPEEELNSSKILIQSLISDSEFKENKPNNNNSNPGGMTNDGKTKLPLNTTTPPSSTKQEADVPIEMFGLKSDPNTSSSSYPKTGLSFTSDMTSASKSLNVISSTATSTAPSSSGLFSSTTTPSTTGSKGVFGGFSITTGQSATTTTTVTSKTVASTTGSPGGIFGSSGPGVSFSSTPKAESIAKTTPSFTSITTKTSTPSTFGGISSTSVAVTTASTTIASNTPASKPFSMGDSGLFGLKTSVDKVSGTSDLSGSSLVITPKTGGGMFGSPTTTSLGVFGSSSPASSETSSASVLTQVPKSPSATSVVSNTTSSSSSSTTTTTTSTLSLDTATTSSSSSAIFGGGGATGMFGASGVKSTSSNMFGTATTSSTTLPSQDKPSDTSPFTATSVFGSTSQSSVFSTTDKPTSNSGILGSSNTLSITPISSAPNVTVTSSSKTTGIFGGSTSATSPASLTTASSSTTTASSISASSSTTWTDGSKSLFGQSSSTTSSAPSVFGGATSGSNQGSIFGGGEKKSSSSIFSGTTQASGKSASVFGGNAQTTASGSLFSSPAASSSSSAFAGSTNPFGGGSTAVTSGAAVPSGSVFGETTATTTSSRSVFGGTTATSSAPSGSVFGGNTATSSAPSGSVFGGNTATSSAPSGSVFGGNTATSIASSGSVFGGNTATNTTASSGSVFGGTTATSTAASGSVFGGTTATSTAASGNVFGGSVFGATTTTSSQGFGTSGQTSIFSSGSTPTLTNPASSSGLFCGLGSAPNPANNTKNVFGSPSTFGASSSANSNIFGGSSNNSSSLFGGTPSNQGSFQSSTAPNATPFGSPKMPPSGSVGGFGGSPSFGGTPGFGENASFGGAPAFGSSPFGGGGTTSPQQTTAVFGSSTNQQAPATFGSQSSSSTTFGNLGSTGGGDGFGSLAAQSGSKNTFDAAGSSPSFGGGSSFTSWR